MNKSNIISQIYSNFSLDPTEDQKSVIESLAEFIVDPSQNNAFILNGYAGTGKTTIISALVKTLKQHGRKFVMMAPTGRAAKVMSQYSSESAFTIHKKIYRQKSALEMQFGLDINKSKNTIFIVDEASMISDHSFDYNVFGSGNLLDDLISYVYSAENCKLILVGDVAQLPPAGSKLSPALDPHNIGMLVDKVWYEQLVEVVRQESESGILHNATIIRNLIEGEIEQSPVFSLGYKDVISISGNDFIDELETAYSKYGMGETIVITRSNKQARRFNEVIRNRVLCQEEEISSGDILMVVKNNYFYNDEENNLDFIANGDVFRIRRLRNYEEKYGFRFIDAQIVLPDYNDVEMECKIMIDTLHSDTPSLTSQQSDRLLNELEKEYSYITRKKERYEKIRENEYFNALQVKFSYAVTCHKAQGGQWDTVFVDRLLYGEEVMTVDFQRWLYTAVTRAKNKLIFLNYDDSFFDIVQDRW